MEKVLGVGDIADRIGTTVGNVYSMRSRGQLPPVDDIVNQGRTLIWLASTIDEWHTRRNTK